MNHSSSAPAQATAHLDCRIAGSLVRIESLPAGVRARLADLFHPFVVAPNGKATEPPVARFRALRRGRGDWLVRQIGPDGGQTAQDDRVSEQGAGRIGSLLAALEWRAVNAALAATTDRAVIHAAALRRGPDALMLIGKSGAGKTTLTLGLIGRGWEPYSDDATIIDAHSLEAQPFPRCFHIDAATIVALPSRPQLEKAGGLSGYVRPLRWADQPARPAAIALVERQPQQPAALRFVSQAEAAGAVLEAMVRNRLSASERARVAAQLASGAQRCYALNNVSLAVALDMIESGTPS